MVLRFLAAVGVYLVLNLHQLDTVVLFLSVLSDIY